MNYMPLRRMLSEMHAREIHAREMHAHEMYAHEIHIHEMYAHEMHANTRPRDTRPQDMSISRGVTTIKGGCADYQWGMQRITAPPRPPLRTRPLASHQNIQQKVAFLNLDISTTTALNLVKFCV
jgi:hypothetical protein